ncbi:hypothetical protein HY641_02070 [Candidatus Woesearchaeota archaeon]|nr:hypothetical protein [Candidatus Woesearchaeota archaeon]
MVGMTNSLSNSFNVFERIDSIKEIPAPICPKEDAFLRRGLIMRCVKYSVSQVERLHCKEAQAYDLLLKHNLKPKTV